MTFYPKKGLVEKKHFTFCYGKLFQIQANNLNHKMSCLGTFPITFHFLRKEKKLKISSQNFAILAIVHSKSGSFITCVFGIVLRSADSTHTLLHYEAKASLLHARVGIFFSDKILVNSRRGKTTGQCGVRHGGDNILLRQKSFFSTQKSRNILV